MADKNLEKILYNLSKSKFRSSFKLKEKDIEYIRKKGMITIKEHTRDFVNKRLSSSNIPNDGKQTPYYGHPTFIAQHATATCCRKCMYKWHHIPVKKDLTESEKNYVVDLIMAWIKNEIIKSKSN